MKSIISLAVALVALPFSVNAGEILPNLYARSFCEAMDMGMPRQSAIKYAMDQAYISSGSTTMVTLSDGTEVGSDSVAAALAATRRCPQYFK